jgi:hypothetical protein
MKTKKLKTKRLKKPPSKRAARKPVPVEGGKARFDQLLDDAVLGRRG